MSKLERKIIITSDGSTTIQIPDWNEQYHSKHGAVQEAIHVFIKNGLTLFKNDDISILEIGFGTGLNAFITFLEANLLKTKVDYVGVEAYPVKIDETKKLNYVDVLGATNFKQVFTKMHDVSWEEKHKLSSDFYLTKRKQYFSEITDVERFNLIYFDAFGARVQPELWTEKIFNIMYSALKQQGVLVTYSAKGSVRRAMQAVGFTVERLPGPPGKREMLRATKK